MEILVAEYRVKSMAVGAYESFSRGQSQEAAQHVTLLVFATPFNRLARAPLVRIVTSGTADITDFTASAVIGEHGNTL
jgi:hypothetical protein